MTKTMKKLGLAIAGSLVVFAGAPADAEAGDYCREYTRTVNIGNRLQEAYGTACLQPDGSWMIVGEGLGNDIPSNVNNVDYVIRDNSRYITPQRVVYYERRPTYYRPATPVFVWGHDGHYRGNHYVPYHKAKYRDYRRDRWDDHKHKGRGRGHDRDRGGVSIQYNWR